MDLNQLQKIKIDNEIRKKITDIFSGSSTFAKILEVEDIINNLDKSICNRIIKEIFKSAKEEDYPINKSQANSFLMGIGNRIGRFIKNAKYALTFRKSRRIIILAEGDSWFEHLFIKETLEHLTKISNYAVYSLAFGGDWISNYLEEKEYLVKLKEIKPDYFLLSGGGNDLVGNGRLQSLVKNRNTVNTEFDEEDKTNQSKLQSDQGKEMAKKIVLGRKFLNQRFWTLLNIFTFQYLLIIRSIENEPSLKKVKIITQGYDYAIPSNKKNKKYLFRSILGHGQWLYYPLINKGIKKSYEQEAIVVAMIYEFNKMLSYLATNKNSFYHIDCRGLAKRAEWNDELHPYSSVFKKIARTIKKCIMSNEHTKIFKAVEHNE